MQRKQNAMDNRLQNLKGKDHQPKQSFDPAASSQADINLHQDENISYLDEP